MTAQKTKRAHLATTALLLAVVSAPVAPARAQGVAPAPALAPSPSPVPAPVKPWGPRLEFVGVPGCVDETDFRNAVATIFDGVDPFDPASPSVLRVTFTKGAGGYRATLVYAPADGKAWPPEPISGAPCFAIVQSAARTSSWRVGDPPKAPPAAPPPSPLPPPQPEPSKPSPDPVPSQAPRVAPASFAELRFEPPKPPPPPPPPPMDLTVALHTAFLLTAGFSNNVGPALQIGADARRDWDTWGLSLALELRGVFPSTMWATDAVDPGKATEPHPFDLSGLSAQLVPCVRFAKYLAACGVVQGRVDMMQTQRFTATFPTVALGPRVGVEVPLSERFAVFAFGEAPFVLYRQGLEFLESSPGANDAPNVYWRQPSVSGFFGAGLVVKLK